MFRASLTALCLLAAVPAAAQDRGGLHTRNAAAELGRIEANSGCPLSATSVTVGVNKATGTGSSAQQQLATTGGGGRSPGCRPLVSTQVVAGANLALGGSSSAGQTITAQGPRGVLATTTFTRGSNIGFGALSNANQRLINQTGR
jgi:hypothetical protein